MKQQLFLNWIFINIASFISWIKHIFEFDNFEIKHSSILYTINDTDDEYCNLATDDFWDHQQKEWKENKDQTEFWSRVDNNKINEIYNTKPGNVNLIIFYTKYYYNNTTYIYMSVNEPISNNKWPPDKKLMCTAPILCAFFLNKDGRRIKEITKKIKRYAGPNNNFHNKTILTSKMFCFTEEYLQEEFPVIEITNILGNKATIPSYEGEFTHKSLWWPKKNSTHQD
jgi:hypothetical protein